MLDVDASTFLEWFALLAAAHAALTLVFVGLGLLAERSAFGRARRIQAEPPAPGQTRRELLGNLRFCLIVPAALAALLSAGVLRAGPDTLLRGALTFVGASLLFDTYFYALHRALHLRPLMRFHRYHHLSRVTGPLSGQSMSAVEALGWAAGFVAVPWLLSQVAPISLIGYFVYLTFNTGGNIVGHANVELGGRNMTRSPTVWLAHPYVFHALHHARFTRHFGFGSTFMDRLAGTEWPDWVDAFEQISRGTPLRDHGKLAGRQGSAGR